MRKTGFLLAISLFWLALSVLSDGINTLVLPERLMRATGENQQATVLGLLSFVGILAGMLVQPVAGAWSDRTRPRWGRKGVLAIGTGLTLLALLVFGFAPGLAGLALSYLLVQICASVVQAAQQGFIPDLVQPEDRGKASGIKSLMDIGGAMLGFVLLGQMLGAGQSGLAAVVISGLILAALVLTILLVREKRPPADALPPPRPGFSAFRVDTRRHRRFLWLVGSRFFFLLGTYAVGRFLLLFVANRLGLPPESAAEQAGNLLAGLALVTILAAPLAGWAADRFGRVPLMLFGALVSMAGVLAYITAASAGAMLLFGGLLSLGSAAFASANWAMTADVAPQDEAARFFGLANFGTAGAAAAAGLFGPLVDGFNRATPGTGFTALFIAAAAAFAISAACLAGLRQSIADSETQAKGPVMNMQGIPVTTGQVDREEQTGEI